MNTNTTEILEFGPSFQAYFSEEAEAALSEASAVEQADDPMPNQDSGL